MTAVQVSIVHDGAGRILSVSQFADGVWAMVLNGEGESVLVTTVDHDEVPELIYTHKVDTEQNRLINTAENISRDSSDVLRDRDTLDSILLPHQDRD